MKISIILIIGIIIAMIASAAMATPTLAFGCVGQQDLIGCDGYAYSQGQHQPPPQYPPPVVKPAQQPESASAGVPLTSPNNRTGAAAKRRWG